MLAANTNNESPNHIFKSNASTLPNEKEKDDELTKDKDKDKEKEKEREREKEKEKEKDIKPKVTKQILPYETEALRLKQKCKDLKQKINDIENQNEIRSIAVSRAKNTIKRLRFEYALLLEVFEKKSLELSIPNLDRLETQDFDAENIESLSLNDITNLLTITPLSIANSSPLPPFTITDHFNKRHDQHTTNHIATPTSGRGKRKRGGATTGGSGHNLNSSSGPVSKKKYKDPNLPKRPTNAYLIFCDVEKDRVKKEWSLYHSDEHLDMSKAMTESWKRLSEDDRKPYYEIYEKDKIRYHKAVEEYTAKKESESPNAVNINNNKQPINADVTDTTIENIANETENHDLVLDTKISSSQQTDDILSEIKNEDDKLSDDNIDNTIDGHVQLEAFKPKIEDQKQIEESGLLLKQEGKHAVKEKEDDDHDQDEYSDDNKDFEPASNNLDVDEKEIKDDDTNVEQ